MKQDIPSGNDLPPLNAHLAAFLEIPRRLSEIERAIERLVEKTGRVDECLAKIAQDPASFNSPGPKKFFTTEEAAKEFGKAEFTVRQWCNEGRINAEKAKCGRGKNGEWRISHVEILRKKNEGLLPPNRDRNRPKGQKPHR